MPDGTLIHGRALARNAVLNLVGEGLPMVVALATIPSVVHGLGAARFGILALAWVVLGYFTIFDLGIGRATTKFVAEALGRSAPEAVPSIAWTALLVQVVLGSVGAIVLAALAPALAGPILNVPAELGREARTAFLLLAPAVPVVLVAGSLRGILEAAQRFDLVNAVKAPSSAANYLLPLVGVLLGWHLPGIVALLVTARALGLVALWLCSVHVFPALRRTPTAVWGDARALIGFGGWVTVSSVISPLIVYVDRFMIGALLTISAVTYYAAPYEMITRLWIIPASLVSTLFPAFSALGRETQPQRLGDLAVRSVKYLLLVLGPILVIAGVWAHDLLRLWLGASFADESTSVVRWLTIGVLMNSVAQVPFAQIQALGRPDLTAKFHLAELPVHIVLVWALVTKWGISGAAIAWSIRAAVDAGLLLAAATRLTRLPASSFVSHRIPETVLLLAGLALATGILDVGLSPGWTRVMAIAVLCGLETLLVWMYALDGRDRARIRQLLHAQPAGRT